ncbi:MAG: helix-turn-helix transcriptional regulator [Lachnospiraceae bacterium]|nr:helix-turn-helix transcriptional regulator [Lachnospiraceae bacterium]
MDGNRLSTTDFLNLFEEDPRQAEMILRDPPVGPDGESFFYEKKLPEYLAELLSQHGLKLSEVVRDSLLSKSYAYQVFAGERVPSRDTLLRIGLAMHLPSEELQMLLRRGGVGPLYPKVRRDAAILFCVGRGLSLDMVESFLEELGETGLFITQGNEQR